MKPYYRHRASLLCAAAANVTLAAPVAIAESSDAVQTSGLQEIVVTAQRTETSLQNTPVAVTALSGQALQEMGATSLLDVQNSTPGLVVSSRAAAGTTQGGFTIRGIGVDSTNSSAAVGIYVDEVYYPSAAANILGIFDVDRVEVLRGPQGTLFGRNTIAGAVQYLTTKPSGEFGGFVEGTVGNLNRVEGGFAVNLPVTDTLAARVSARYDREGGFVTDESAGVKRGGEVTKQGRFQLRWKPMQGLTVDAKFEGLNLYGNGRAVSLLAFNTSLNPPGTPNGGAALVFAALATGLNPTRLSGIHPSQQNYSITGFNGPDFQEFDYREGQVNVALEVNDHLTLKSITAYSSSNDHNPSDLDDSPLPIIENDSGFIDTTLFSQEIQIIGRVLDDKLHFTLGGYYYDSKSTVVDQADFFGLSPVATDPTLGDIDQRDKAEAGYGQATYDLTSRFSASLGVRYSSETVTGSFLNTKFP